MNLPPPAYTTNGQSAPPPPVAGGVQAFTYASTKRTYETFKGRHAVGLGGVMIFAGLLCISFNIVSVSTTGSDNVSAVGYGIWSGVMFIITGIFGLIAARKKTLCKIIAFMVLCIIASALCLILFIFSIAAAISASHGWCGGRYHRDEEKWILYECSKVAAMEALQACLALIVTICAIWGSVLCCKAVCCCASTGQVLLPVQYIPMQQGNQQMLFYPTQQGGPQGSSTEIIIGGDMSSASGRSYNNPENIPYNPQLYGQGPPIYNEHKVPL